MRSARDIARTAIRRGDRTVLLTYNGLGLGNYLYFLLHAHTLAAQGRNYRVARVDTIEPWLASLPSLDRYLVRFGDIRLRDRREHIPASFLQGFDQDFSRSELTNFVSDVLLTAPMFQDWHARAAELREERVLTVNIRRGDYYEVEKFRRIYGFDVASYVHDAVREANSKLGPFGRIHVVSDGISWCRTNLPWLHDYSHAVSFVGEDEKPEQHLRDLSLSPVLVLPNSTFSFWAAYISNVVHEHNHASVWAPRFFGRGLYSGDGSAWQLDPWWNVIEDVRGVDASGHG